MRVIAGSAKGRRLKGPPARASRGHSPGARPTSDLVRGAIFSALASRDVDMARVLDLYAGSGALGIEALSRGGEWCDFVERDHKLSNVIRENLRATGMEDRAQVYCMPVERATERLQGPYTLILADPPYGDATAAEALSAIASSPLVEPGRTVMVLEHGARDEPQEALGPLPLVGTRRHGDSAVSLYEAE